MQTALCVIRNGWILIPILIDVTVQHDMISPCEDVTAGRHGKERRTWMDVNRKHLAEGRGGRKGGKDRERDL